MRNIEGGGTRRSGCRRFTDAVFIALVSAAGLVAVSTLIRLDWPPVGADEANNHRLGTAVGLAYEPAAVSFEGDRAEALGPLALAEIDYPWGSRLPGWTVAFVDGDGHVAGYTWSQETRIEVFVRPGDDLGAVTRVLAHELGHAVDVTLNDGSERGRWLEQRNASTTTWWPTSGAADFETGAGDFAEVFAVWQADNDDFRSRVAGPPTPEDFALMRSLAYD